ncbi:hypothetical protein P4B35_23140 [Pontiellaceae bacterium B12227]|nr:hypothetical protein [Pontiellaceae bacterium B12227]
MNKRALSLLASSMMLQSWAVTDTPNLNSSSETITSVEQADELVRQAQDQFWMLFPPSADWLYVHTEKSVRPVVWSFGWPDAMKKNLYAEMKAINGNLYPVYTIWAEADRVTGDLTYYNMYGTPMWTSLAPKGYTPLSPVLDRYGVNSVGELSEQQKQFTASSIGLEIQLLPESFITSYVQDVATESYLSMAMSTAMAPMGMMVSMESEPELQMDIGSQTNGAVEIFVEWLSSLDSDTLDLFHATDLVAANWQLETNFPTAGVTNFYFSDQDTNQTARFYVTGTDYDGDEDGLTSAREKYLHGTRADLFDTDGDGLGDGWEFGYGFNPLSTTGTNGAVGDVDNDGYSNLEEQHENADPTDPADPGAGSTGTVATIRYYYDDDDRLTDFYVGSEVAQKTILTDAHNISEEVSAK